MRVPIAHQLPREEVRRRLHSRSHEISEFHSRRNGPGDTAWPDEDTMTLAVKAMGQGITGRVLIEEHQVVFEVDLPAALSFVEPMVAGAIRQKGQKLLEKK